MDFLVTRWKSLIKGSSSTTFITSLTLFFFFILAMVLMFAGWIDPANYSHQLFRKPLQDFSNVPTTTIQYPMNCTSWNQTNTCPKNYPTKFKSSSNNPKTCPEYFRWIHEDLKPWKKTGITRNMVEKASKTAHFRLVILDGKIYVDKFKASFQSRSLFTIWGIVQLLRFYPGKLPDLELMFDCDDMPVVRAKDYGGGFNSTPPPPLFKYSSDGFNFDIVFPDWSFWGWAELNIKPWRILLKDIKEGNQKTKWEDRVPFAYWKGNPHVSRWRSDLMKCNVTDRDNWNTLLYIQNWNEESKKGFNQSNLEDQCTHRYKIYIEGRAWSVSGKYILACDSPTLLISPRYYDFFMRGLVPLKHYWPIEYSDKCRSLKFAVEWGNNYTHKAQAIGEAGSKFIQEDMKMEYIYDYMFHLLNEYSKLLKFKPKIPINATQICSETMACSEDGIWRKFMELSLEKSPSNSQSCTMPSPYDPPSLKAFVDEKDRTTKEVEGWVNEYWEKHNKKE